MKYIREEISGKGNMRTLFALGKEEMKILDGLLKNALLHIPLTLENQPQNSRMQNMKREMEKALKETSEDNIIYVDFEKK
jgi:hypothetical protein